MSTRTLVAYVLLLVSSSCSGITSSADANNQFPSERTGDSRKWYTSTSADRTSMTLVQGSTGVFHLTTIRGNGFTGKLQYSFTQIGSLGVSVTNIVTVGTTTTADLVVVIPPAWPPVTDYHFLTQISGTTPAVVNPGFIDLVLNVTKAP